MLDMFNMLNIKSEVRLRFPSALVLRLGKKPLMEERLHHLKKIQ